MAVAFDRRPSQTRTRNTHTLSSQPPSTLRHIYTLLFAIVRHKFFNSHFPSQPPFLLLLCKLTTNPASYKNKKKKKKLPSLAKAYIMGNGLSITPCLHLPGTTAPAAVRLVYWGGRARLLAADGDAGARRVTAGDVAAELPAPATDHAVCPADAFFVGLPVPVMPPGEELQPGRTYFVLPASRFTSLKTLTAATLAALAPGRAARKPAAAAAAALLPLDGQCPFEYVKGDGGGGAALIRVLPEFIEKLITRDGAVAKAPANKGCASAAELLCSTPELKRHYAQLVGPRSRPWSPRLETIAESDRSRWLRSPASMLSSR
jgi:hypothetical protein